MDFAFWLFSLLMFCGRVGFGVNCLMCNTSVLFAAFRCLVWFDFSVDLFRVMLLLFTLVLLFDVVVFVC